MGHRCSNKHCKHPQNFGVVTEAPRVKSATPRCSKEESKYYQRYFFCAEKKNLKHIKTASKPTHKLAGVKKNTKSSQQNHRTRTKGDTWD